MRHARIKKVISKKGRVMYYLGNGLWFGRISAERAEVGLSSGRYSLFETVFK
jgi:hypothetical protein